MDWTYEEYRDFIIHLLEQAGEPWLETQELTQDKESDSTAEDC